MPYSSCYISVFDFFLNHDFKSFCILNDIKKVYQLYFMRLSTSQNDQRPPIAFLLVGIHAKSQQEVAIDAAFIIVLFHHYEQLLLSPIGIFCRLFLFLQNLFTIRKVPSCENDFS